MEIYNKPQENKGIAIALGFFDGIHIGHKKIISTLVNESKVHGYKTAIVTFNKNPADWFNKEPSKAIQTFKDKELILESMGIDYLYELDFNDVKDLDSYSYVKDILYKNFEPKLIVAGYNHNFGKEKQGNSETLKNLSSEFNYNCIIVPEQNYENEKISSTIIRQEIEKGHLNKVQLLLGRPFSIRNSVIKGMKLATKLGYPTANLIWADSLVKLPYGVYLGYTLVDKKLYPSLINWGTKPTVSNDNEEILESHIYDFKENIYGKIINVLFIEKLRDERKFSSLASLKAQLDCDYNQFKTWVNNSKN